MKIDMKIIEQYLKKDYLRKQVHPTLPLTIYNYTNTAAWESIWDDITKVCRGLVIDDHGNVVGRCLEKFFNYSELKAHNKVPKGSFRLFEKMDGSYIQIFRYKGEIVISSRGSFTSEQAVWATELFTDAMAKHIEEGKTYVFELIHPNNRIVLDYSGRKELVLLAIIDTETGDETDTDTLSDVFTLPKTYGFNDMSYEELFDMIEDDEEGYICLFDNGKRMKIKGVEYCRLHRIVTNCSSKDLWNMLRNNTDVTEFTDRVPDEWIHWFFSKVGEMTIDFMKYKQAVMKEWNYGIEVGHYYVDTSIDKVELISSRKDISKFFKTCQHTGLLYTLLDNNSIDDSVWVFIKPEFEKGFMNTNTSQ